MVAFDAKALLAQRKTAQTRKLEDTDGADAEQSENLRARQGEQIEHRSPMEDQAPSELIVVDEDRVENPSVWLRTLEDLKDTRSVGTTGAVWDVAWFAVKTS